MLPIVIEGYGFIYILTTIINNQPKTKIGRTYKNPNKRIRAIITGFGLDDNNTQVTLFGPYDFNYKIVEKDSHTYFQALRVTGEWFVPLSHEKAVEGVKVVVNSYKIITNYDSWFSLNSDQVKYKSLSAFDIQILSIVRTKADDMIKILQIIQHLTKKDLNIYISSITIDSSKNNYYIQLISTFNSIKSNESIKHNILLIVFQHIGQIIINGEDYYSYEIDDTI